jgi:tellurite resistance protein
MTPVQPQVSGKPIDTSTFYMWRCVIAIAHADGRVQDQERAYLQKIFANMDRVYGLTAEQKTTFAKDIDSASMQSIPELLSHINDPGCRSQVIYFGGLLARADGVLDPREDDILKKLRADQMTGIDMQQIHAHVKEAVASEMFRYDLAQQALRPQDGLSGMLDSLMLRTGIDLMD